MSGSLLIKFVKVFWVQECFHPAFIVCERVQVIMPTEVKETFIGHAGSAGGHDALIRNPENPSSQMNNEESD
jgi:hypothetical protein